MTTNSKIQWTHHTFNPWRGCAKVSPGCTHCYAETLSKRNPSVLGTWGRAGTRPIGSDAYWRQPVAWNKAAAKAGERRRVFCASLADVFEDRPDLVEPRARLFHLIAETPNLDWLLLTKRPENIQRLWSLVAPPPTGPRGAWPNVWLGTTVEDQQRADERIPLLLQTPAAVRFLSVEPLLGPVDLRSVRCFRCRDGAPHFNALAGRAWTHEAPGPGIDWVIVGGESGPGARPCNVAWIRSVVEQCREAGVPCFVKQLGANVIDRNDAGFDGDEPTHWPNGPALEHDLGGSRDGYQGAPVRVRLLDKKGGDPAEWPEDLRVREFPEARP